MLYHTNITLHAAVQLLALYNHISPERGRLMVEMFEHFKFRGERRNNGNSTNLNHSHSHKDNNER